MIIGIIIVAHIKDMKKKENITKEKADNLPREFSYYCPNCGHQTNKGSNGKCPQCQKGELKETE